MRDIFGVEMSPDELRRWDAACFSLWHPQPTSWNDIPREGYQPPATYWPHNVPVDPLTLAGQRVLELGCGIGNCAPPIMYAGGLYTGLDVSRLALHVARSRLREWPVARWVNSLTEAALGEAWAGEWDMIFGVSFWIHQEGERRRKLLSVVSEWLVPGGLLLVDFWPGEVKVNPEKVYGDWEAFTTNEAALAAEGERCGLQALACHRPSELRNYLTFVKRG